MQVPTSGLLYEMFHNCCGVSVVGLLAIDICQMGISMYILVYTLCIFYFSLTSAGGFSLLFQLLGKYAISRSKAEEKPVSCNLTMCA